MNALITTLLVKQVIVVVLSTMGLRGGAALK
jgi:hypothetical protein